MASKSTYAVPTRNLSTSSGATPAAFQIDASQFCYERDGSLLFGKVGSGKTPIYLMTMQDWIEEQVCRRIMLTAPLRVINHVWRQEAAKWHSPLTFSICTGELTPKQQRLAVEAKTNVLLVNNAMVPRVLGHGGHGCDGLVIDEISKYRDPTGLWSKTIRTGPFNVRSGGTGTPAPNGLCSLYGMCHAVGHGKLVGRNFDKWRRKYFYPTDYQQFGWEPFVGAPEALAELIRPFTYVIDENLVPSPPVMKVPIRLDLPKDLREPYEEMRKTLMLSDEEIVAANNGVARSKLRQIASGFAYDSQGVAVRLGDWRLNVLADLVDEMNGQPLIVAYEFREQREMMKRKWPHMRFIGGGTSAAEDNDTKDLWSRRKISLLGMHPASAGHGLNDMDLGGSAVAWWQPPDDLEHFDQLMGRLTRRGQTASHVRAYMLVTNNTIDGAVFNRLGEKDDAQRGFWNSLRP